MSCAVVFALKRAIESAREEVGNTDTFSLCEFGRERREGGSGTDVKYECDGD